MKEVDQTAVIKFVNEHILHRFGIPESIVSDQAQYFVGKDVTAFAQEMGIFFTHSSPYFAQGNGQAEATNKILKSIIQKMLDDNPRNWHEALPQAVWAYRTSQRGPTRTTPYALVYGHDAVLPMERAVNTLRVRKQPPLEDPDYRASMLQVLDTIEQTREEARGGQFCKTRQESNSSTIDGLSRRLLT